MKIDLPDDYVRSCPFTDEPSVSDMQNLKENDFRFIEAFNWYNYEFNADDAHKFVIEYMKETGYSTNEIAQIKSLPPYFIGQSVGWLCKMVIRGIQLPKSKQLFLKLRIENNLTKEEIPFCSTVEEFKKKNTVQDLLREKAGDHIAVLCGQIDRVIINGSSGFDVVEFFKEQKLSGPVLGYIKKWAVAEWSAMVEAINSDDTEYGLAHIHDNIYEQINFTKSIVEACSDVKAIIPRKPRKKKIRKVSDQIKKLQFQKENENPKLVSIDPAHIPNAKQLWVYDTKYKKLTVFRSENGLAIKGTTILNFDSDSECRRLRHPEEVLTNVLKSGKIALRKTMNELTTKPIEVKGRIGKTTILLRVEK